MVRIYIFLAILFIVINGGCSKKSVQPEAYEHQRFYFEKKVIVQTKGDYFVNDIKKEEGNGD